MLVRAHPRRDVVEHSSSDDGLRVRQGARVAARGKRFGRVGAVHGRGGGGERDRVGEGDED